MTHVVRLSEFSLLRFLFLALARRRLFILTVRPTIPQIAGWLGRIANWAVKTGRAYYAIELVPELEPYWRWERQLYFKDTFKKYEPWQDAYYDFSGARARGDDYSYGFMQITCTHVYERAIEIFLIEALTGRFPGNDIRIRGVPKETLDMCRAYFGPNSIGNTRPAWHAKIVVNAALALVSIAYSVIWVARRTRLSSAPRSVFCILDCLGNEQETYLAHELQDGGEVALLDRTPGQTLNANSARHAAFETYNWGSGAFGIAGGARAILEISTDVLRLSARHWDLTPRHFFEVAGMPHKRIVWRGLFNLCKPAHFFGRDEYNVDHILRRPELHRVGAVSHGLSGAVYSGFTSLAPNSRYVSYDYHYSFGVPLFKEYVSNWRQDMKLRSIGIWGLSRDQLETFRRSDDGILVTLRIAWAQPEMLRMVREIAAAYPQRKVVLQIKMVHFLPAAERAAVIARYCDGLPNIVYSEERIYDLLQSARIHISDISTVVTESIQLGLFTLVADVLDQAYCIFREFPGLCVRDAEELLARVQAIDVDDNAYPRADYLRRMGLDGSPIAYDVIRDTVGLPVPRETVSAATVRPAVAAVR